MSIVRWRIKISTESGNRKEASVPDATAITMSVRPFRVADQGFLSSRYPQIMAIMAQRYKRAYCQVTRVKSPTPTNMQEIKITPAEVGLPFADAPSTAKALPPSDGSFLFCNRIEMNVNIRVKKGPIRYIYFV